MKIKLAILESDTNYLRRIISTFNDNFSDKLETYSFTDAAAAECALNTTKIDVLLASEKFPVNTRKIPKGCGFAYLVDSFDNISVNGQKAICKFQKIDLIYKEILSVYSEVTLAQTGTQFNGNSDMHIISFLSPSGGVGSSSVAVAYAIYLSKRGKKVLYLNMEQFGDCSLYFYSEGKFSFSDVIYTIKSDKANLTLKLESTVKKDKTGVYFFDSCNTAFDLFELSSNDIIKLFNTLKAANTYDYIVLDMNFLLNEVFTELLNFSTKIVFVSDGSEVSNLKFTKALKALQIVEHQTGISILDRVSVMYNKFSNKTSSTIKETSIKALGGIPKFEHASSQQIIEQISEKDLFKDLV